LQLHVWRSVLYIRRRLGELGQPKGLLGSGTRTHRDGTLSAEDGKGVVLGVLGEQRSHRNMAQDAEALVQWGL